MLYGRSAELSSLEWVIERARAGCGGPVTLRGEAGAGRTALLDAVTAAAGGMRVLRATGVEAESDLAFAALHQVLWPVIGSLDALPGPQGDAVRAALGLGRRVVTCRPRWHGSSWRRPAGWSMGGCCRLCAGAARSVSGALCGGA